MKMSKFCTSKDTMKMWNGIPHGMEENICKLSDERLIYRI